MKHCLLAALLLATSALADSPEAILKDYRKQATQAVERLKQSLEKTAMPLITKLVKDGDTAGAELLTVQLKEKLAGESVLAPQASAASLFNLYDEARAKALAPVQKSSIARIDSMLKTAGGAKLETLTELGKVKEEIEAGKVISASDLTSNLPVLWTYRASPTGPPLIKVFFEHNGTARTEAGPDTQSGTWAWKKRGVFVAKLTRETWTITIKKGGYAELENSNLNSMRYLVPEQKQP